MEDVQGLLEEVGRRHELIVELESGPATKPELVASVDVSRSTVDRAIRALEAAGVVSREDGQYELTLFGRMLAAEYGAFCDRIDGLLAAEPLLESLPSDAPLDPVAVVGAEVVTADRTDPYRPTDRHFTFVDRADQTDILGTVLSPQYVPLYHERVVEDGMRLRAALPPDLVQRVVTDFADPFEEMVDTGRCELRQLDSAPPFTHSVVRTPEATHLGIIVYHSDGIRGYVRNDSPTAVAWGRTFFERQWEAATPITAAQSREA